MPNQIWSPEEGDEVQMQDGRTGIVGDIDSMTWDGGSDWQVTITIPGVEEDEETETEAQEEEVLSDQLIRYDEVQRGWKEV